MMTNDAMVQRLTAPNPGFMTGNGTNSYLLRAASGACLVIDPGPAIDSHIQALLDAAGDAALIRAIVLTHMHADHSPAAMPLAKATGATIYAPFSVDDPYQDRSCRPDQLVVHQQLLQLEDIRLRCIHTPGHVDNHMCYLLENQGLLFAGDHLMQGSTVVIIPPHGDMQKYLASLALLQHYSIRSIAPGHGDRINDPQQEIARIIAHRLAREDKLLQLLEQLQPASTEQLLVQVYDDVPDYLHGMARHSLLAHLIKLQQQARIEQQDQQWVIKK